MVYATDNIGIMMQNGKSLGIDYYCFTNLIADHANLDSTTDEITVTCSYCLILDESRCFWKCSGHLSEEPQKPQSVS